MENKEDTLLFNHGSLEIKDPLTNQFRLNMEILSHRIKLLLTRRTNVCFTLAINNLFYYIVLTPTSYNLIAKETTKIYCNNNENIKK